LRCIDAGSSLESEVQKNALRACTPVLKEDYYSSEMTQALDEQLTSSQEGEARPKVVAELAENYVFRMSFPDTNNVTFIMDEPPPLGSLSGPNASRVLAAAVANCVSASLLFCLRRSKVDVSGIRTEAKPLVERNKDGYWRVTTIDVKIRPELSESADQDKTKRCLDIFEKYCVVTGGVREGIKVNVEVEAGASRKTVGEMQK